VPRQHDAALFFLLQQILTLLLSLRVQNNKDNRKKQQGQQGEATRTTGRSNKDNREKQQGQQEETIRITGRNYKNKRTKRLFYYPLPIRKQSSAYTQSIERLYANVRVPMPDLKRFV